MKTSDGYLTCANPGGELRQGLRTGREQRAGSGKKGGKSGWLKPPKSQGLLHLFICALGLGRPAQTRRFGLWKALSSHSFVQEGFVLNYNLFIYFISLVITAADTGGLNGFPKRPIHFDSIPVTAYISNQNPLVLSRQAPWHASLLQFRVAYLHPI
jgi:hypothetical protein